MFSNESQNLLQEKLGYEQWVLQESINILELNKGKLSSYTVEINDNSPVVLKVMASEHFGASLAADLINEMSPLLFSASYKILDMVIEWIIHENQGDCPWQFSKKISLLNDKQGSLTLPTLFSFDTEIFNVLVRLYSNLVDFRNAITHGKWGKNQEGNLSFNFEKRDGSIIKTTISFEQVMGFSECMAWCANELINHSTTPEISEKVALSIKWSLDKLHSLHGGTLFGIPSPRFFKVIRRTKLNDDEIVKIDLKGIRKTLNDITMNSQYAYSLLVEAEVGQISLAWEIASSCLPEADDLILDSSWDLFKV